MDKPFGIDVSSWQGKIDWEVISAHTPKVHFIGIRSGISWGYSDKWFARNWAEAKRVRILRSAYHVIYPASSALRQMDHLFHLLKEDFGELPITLDMELDHGQSKDRVTSAILECADIIRARSGVQPIVYSRANWIDTHTNEGTWRNAFKWWLAQYLRENKEHPGPPRLPKGVDREHCIIHQTAAMPPSFGVESKELDYNRWQGDLMSLYAFVGDTPLEPELSVKEKVDRLWKGHPELH